MNSANPTSMNRRIYYHDTDAGGVVYYANYLKFMEEARFEFLHSHGFPVDRSGDQEILFPVAHCSISYRRPARLGDMLICTAGLTRITRARMIFRQDVRLKDSHELLVEADITLACVNADLRPIAIPADIRAHFA
ncbi:MAG: YbgC/FadM family acyl-CoA thioesterase [Candidatus Omnitrophota bacterium]